VMQAFSVQETAEHFQWFHQDKLVARHLKAARHKCISMTSESHRTLGSTRRIEVWAAYEA